MLRGPMIVFITGLILVLPVMLAMVTPAADSVTVDPSRVVVIKPSSLATQPTTEPSPPGTTTITVPTDKPVILIPVPGGSISLPAPETPWVRDLVILFIVVGVFGPPIWKAVKDASAAKHEARSAHLVSKNTNDRVVDMALKTDPSKIGVFPPREDPHS